LTSSGELAIKRRRQALAWTWHLIDAGLRERFRGDRAVRDALPAILQQVAAGTLTPSAAAAQLLDDIQGR
jgi:LAO/AO transport system kinase